MTYAEMWSTGLPYIMRLPQRGTDQRRSAFGIIANVLESDRAFRKGAKAWLAGGTGGACDQRFKWIALSRGGRRVEKWAPTTRFHNFRAAWIPEHLEGDVWYITGMRPEMEAEAERLNALAEELRNLAPNRRQ